MPFVSDFGNRVILVSWKELGDIPLFPFFFGVIYEELILTLLQMFGRNL